MELDQKEADKETKIKMEAIHKKIRSNEMIFNTMIGINRNDINPFSFKSKSHHYFQPFRGYTIPSNVKLEDLIEVKSDLDSTIESYTTFFDYDFLKGVETKRRNKIIPIIEELELKGIKNYKDDYGVIRPVANSNSVKQIGVSNKSFSENEYDFDRFIKYSSGILKEVQKVINESDFLYKLKDDFFIDIDEVLVSISKPHWGYLNMLEAGIVNSFESLKNWKDNFNSIPANRGSEKRYFVKNDTSFFSDLIDKYHDTKIFEESETIQFNKKWIKYFGIADDIIFDVQADYSISNIKVIKSGKTYNLADLGFGFSQLLPIILAIGYTLKDGRKIGDSNATYSISHPRFDGKVGNAPAPNPTHFILEEPETNLHPALQSKLADMIIECYVKYDMQFTIETHSEYLIRKLQFLIADEKFNHQDANIYYFHPPDKIPDGENQVKRIDFEKNGNLTDSFGTGFVDEATNMVKKIFSLQNRKN